VASSALSESHDRPWAGALMPETVLDAVPCLVLVMDRTTARVLHMNRALQQVVGRADPIPVDLTWESLFDAGDRTSLQTAIATSGPATGVETGIRGPEATARRILWSVEHASDHSLGSDLAVLTGIDVTPQGRTSGLFSQLLRTAASPALVGTDAQGRVTLCNHAAERMLGRDAASMVGRPLDISIFDRDEFLERAERLGVPPDARLLAANLSALDRRRRDLDLGSLDRRRRDADRRGGGRREGDRREGDRREGDRREGDRREGDRREGDRREGDRRAYDAPERRGRGAGAPGGALARDWTLIRKDGDRFTASLSVFTLTDEAGGVEGYLAVADDVTEQRASRSLLVAGLERQAEAVRRLEELDRAKDDFVATVSHELRTPITSILGYVELLLDSVEDKLDSDQLEMLHTVRRNGDRLRALADDLLTLSSFGSDEFTLLAAPVDLCDIVTRVDVALRPLIGDRRLEAAFDIPAHPVVVMGDAAHLERVLFNLLGNALKFTEDGGSIRCSVDVRSDEAVIAVADTGDGIPEAEQDQIFTRFYRSSNARERAVQGAGMGLAIVATIVERHGGRITISSREGEGTEVRIFLPVNQERFAV
jgi:signal transduction histidine kinase